MEDFGWLIFLAVFWIFSTIGETRKQRSKQRRQQRRERAEEERRATGPAAGQRDLARDVESGARRAEEALRRWESRQKAAAGASAADAVSVGRARTEAGPEAPRRRRGRARVHDPEAVRLRRQRDVARRRAADVRASAEARDERRDAYEAIAGMLAGREIGGTDEIGAGAELEVRRELPPPAAVAPAAPASSLAGGAAFVVSRPSAAGAAGLARLDRLPLLQRAIALREVLGPPRALSPESELP